jgi:predicted metal-dependent peptidase
MTDLQTAKKNESKLARFARSLQAKMDPAQMEARRGQIKTALAANDTNKAVRLIYGEKPDPKDEVACAAAYIERSILVRENVGFLRGVASERLGDARLILRVKAPYSRALLTNLTVREVWGLGTIGVTHKAVMIYDPAWLAQWSIEQIAGLLMHELMHMMLRHGSRCGSRDPGTWNVAGDLSINPAVAGMSLELPTDGCWPKKLGWPEHETADEYYERLTAKPPQSAKRGKPEPDDDPEEEDEESETLHACDPDDGEGDEGEGNEDQDGDGEGEDADDDETDEDGGDSADHDDEGEGEPGDPPDATPSGGNPGDESDDEESPSSEPGEASGEGDSGEGDPSDGEPGEGEGEPGTGAGDPSAPRGSPENPVEPRAAPGVTAGHCGSCAGYSLDGEETVDDEKGRGERDIDRIMSEVARDIQEEDRKSRGSVPGMLRRWAESSLAPPKIPWQQKLAFAVRRACQFAAGAVTPRWSEPNRRQNAVGFGSHVPILPVLKRPVPHVAVIVDTSGSMGTGDLSACLRECGGVLAAVGAEVQFCACDATVNSFQKVSDPNKIAELLKGGGGTDFRPPLKAVSEAKPKPEIVIFMTDGCGPAPKTAPRGMDVVWLLVGRSRQKPVAVGDGDNDWTGNPVNYGTFVEVDD